MPTARVSQTPVTVAYSGGAVGARVSQVPITLVYVDPAPVRASQTPITTVYPLRPLPLRMLIPSRPLVEIWQWKTSIFKSLYGDEQRMALRSEPFLQIQASVPLKNNEDRIAIRYAFHRFADERVNYPLFQYSTPLTATTSIGGSTLTFDPEDTNVRDNEPIAIFNSDLSVYYVVETGAVSGTGIALASQAENEYASGLYVAPAPAARFNPGGTMAMRNNDGTATVNFSVVPPRALLRPDASETVSTYDSLPIIPDLYRTETPVPEQFMFNLNTLDTMLQDPNDEKTWLDPQLITARKYRVLREDMDKWRAFGGTIKGGQKAFLLPSYRSDFTLSETPALGSNKLTTEDTYIEDYLRYEANQYLLIDTANGSEYHKVIDTRLNHDRTLDIFLQDNLGASAGDNEISKIGLMHKVRLNGDTFTFTHHINHIDLDFGASGVNF